MRAVLAVLVILIAAAVLVSRAHAQGPVAGASIVSACGTPNSAAQYVVGSTAPLTMTTGGVLCQGGAGGVAGGVTLVPTTGTPTEITVTCGVTTTALLAAAAATNFILVKVPSGGGTIWYNAAGVAAVAAPPSIDLTGGQSQVWSAATGYLPSSALNCIAPVAQAVTLVYK